MKKKLLLAEIIIVTLLLSILGIIFIPKFIISQETAKVALAKLELSMIDKGFKLYHQDYEEYPQPISNSLTHPSNFKKIIEGAYVNQEYLEDIFLEDTNGTIKVPTYFWKKITASTNHYDHYNQTTNQYRGMLPASYHYNLGSAGPDQFLNLDRPNVHLYQTDTVLSSIPSGIPKSTKSLIKNRELVIVIESHLLKTNQTIRYIVDKPTYNAIKRTHDLVLVEGIPSHENLLNLLPFQTFLDYDPSNGVISSGDIHLLGP